MYGMGQNLDEDNGEMQILNTLKLLGYILHGTGTVTLKNLTLLSFIIRFKLEWTFSECSTR